MERLLKVNCFELHLHSHTWQGSNAIAFTVTPLADYKTQRHCTLYPESTFNCTLTIHKWNLSFYVQLSFIFYVFDNFSSMLLFLHQQLMLLQFLLNIKICDFCLKCFLVANEPCSHYAKNNSHYAKKSKTGAAVM